MTLEEFIRQLETFCPEWDVPLEVEVLTEDNNFPGVDWQLHVMAGCRRVRFVIAPKMEKEGGKHDA